MMPPVCVTGANGFIGGHIVEQLLEKGHTVVGTVRDPSAPKNKFLLDIAARHAVSGGKLLLKKADLNIPGSFHEAVKGCEVVVHVAAVVTTAVKECPYKEIIDPTCEGIRNIVDACKAHGVRRIVYTSSVSTILMAEKHRRPELRGKPFDEDHWAHHVSPSYGTYNYSKIVSEHLLSELWKGELVSILPSWVIGPQQNDQITSSQQVVRAIANREYPLCPRFYFDCVDVRDVAGAHIFAVENATMPSGRYNVSSGRVVSASQMADAMNHGVPGLNVSTRMMPWVAMWLASWVDKRISTYLLYERCVPYPPVSNEKLKGAGYAFRYTDLQESLRDAVASFKEFGVLKAGALPPGSPQ